MNATRFAQKPLPQPAYNFGDVSRPARDLSTASLQRINDRTFFQTCMAEMLLLCKEAVRRRPAATPQSPCRHSLNGTAAAAASSGGSSKPLSLEYLADRLDVDDPVWGFLIRDQAGRMQGFVTVTTFTNYQRTFRWDSQNAAAWEHDGHERQREMRDGVRVWDRDNQLARGLQNSVHGGDIWNEGIVWPRIAEISLLGALGCGKALVSLVIEELECMRATGKCNYDYVVLQATDNSIPFYESMGFLRVGAVMQDEATLHRQAQLRGSMDGTNNSSSSRYHTNQHTVGNASEDEEPVADPVPTNSPEKNNSLATHPERVTSKVTTYAVRKAGETVSEIAKTHQVDAWDMVFLNHTVYTDLSPSSRLLEGTVLLVPVYENIGSCPPPSPANQPQWYLAKENETPRSIARKLGLDCLALVQANQIRLPDLLSNSRLKDGTRIKVSLLDVVDEAWKPYAHWAFPDDDFEEGEPSYMMALQLNCRRGSKHRPFLQSLAVPISPYSASPLLLPPSPVKRVSTTVAKSVSLANGKMNAVKPSAKRRRTHPDEPVPPKRPVSAYLVFANQQRVVWKDKLEGLSVAESSKLLADRWKAVPDRLKERYEKIAEQARIKYRLDKEQYDKELASFEKAHPPAVIAEPTVVDDIERRNSLTGGTPSDRDIKYSLFNKVVRLKAGAMTEGSNYDYWYVLTFIPDLKWCHLAPMIQVGTFGSDKPRVEGRPKYKLVDESLGKEVDISSSFCIPIKSKSVKRTLDADKEEWDIIDDGSDPCSEPKNLSRRSVGALKSISYDSDYNSLDAPVPVRTSTAIKPSAVERKRKLVKLGAKSQSQRLVAVCPTTGAKVVVRIKCTAGQRGRPRGSVLGALEGPSKSTAETDLSVARKGCEQREDTHRPLSDREASVVQTPIGYGRSRSIGNPTDALESPTVVSGNRPRRKAAPAFMGESPSSLRKFRQSLLEAAPVAPSTNGLLQGVAPKFPLRRAPAKEPKCRQRKHDADTLLKQSTRSKREASPSFLGMDSPRKRRQVNSAGSKRSVLQN